MEAGDLVLYDASGDELTETDRVALEGLTSGTSLTIGDGEVVVSPDYFTHLVVSP